MITMGNYEVLEGKEGIFESAFVGMNNAMREETAHVRSALYRDVNGPRSYLVVSEWRSEVGLQEFLGSARFAQLSAWALDQVLAARPTHQRLQAAAAQRSIP